MPDKNTQQTSRAPIVTVLGHVDHGKTTLLDTIRKTNAVSREAGGITQTIGASVITTPDGHKITFIDTPGHAAFSQMRKRGAKIADMVILVVAADDAVMPQTKEAITYIKETKVPLVVAITKMDLPGANPEVVKGQLEKEGIFLEGRGGDTPVVAVSAKKGEGISDLLEVIVLMAEVSGLKGALDSPLDGSVIETGKDKSGLTVSAVVRDGELKVGQEIVAGGVGAKVRGLFDSNSKPVKSVGPGDPVLILGFSDLPVVGSQITTPEYAESGGRGEKVSAVSASEAEITIILKAQSQGVLEAILGSLPQKVAVLESGVGDVAESDVFMAKSAGVPIFVFEARIPSAAKKLAETEGVSIESFRIIYELLKKLEDMLKAREVKVLGKAQIVQSFPFNVTKKIAGSRMLEGVIKSKDKLLLMRGEKEIGEVRIVSLRKGKNEISEVKNGEEFGVYFEPQFDFQPHDVLLSLSYPEK